MKLCPECSTFLLSRDGLDSASVSEILSFHNMYYCAVCEELYEPSDAKERIT